MYVIEVKYANGETERFDNIESYAAVCNGLIFKLYHADSDLCTMIPINQVIRIGKVKDAT